MTCKVTQVEVFPRGNSIPGNFRFSIFAYWTTCSKDLKNSAKSGSPKLLRLKTCPKDLTISCRSRNSQIHIGGPSQLGNISLLSLSLNLQGASRVADPGVAQNLVSSRGNFNPRSSGIQNKLWNPKAAQIEVFPRNYFDLSNFGTSELSNLEILGSFCCFG